MSNDNKFYIPKYIDEPFKIILFSIDEFVIIVSVFGFSYAIGHEFIGLVAAFLAYGAYSHIKGKESASFLQRCIYWYLGFGPQHCIPKAALRKYKG